MTISLNRLLTCCVALLLAGGCASGPKYHPAPSPDQAVTDLVAALESGSKEKLHAVLGPDAQSLISSGDPLVDQADIEAFLAKYRVRHALQPNDSGTRTLVVGEDAWPFPFPIVAVPGGWGFDVQAGIEEMDARRIGRNEHNTIQVCLAIVDAQLDYAQLDVDGDGIGEYARKIASDPGTHNGLYWTAAEGEPQSPLGPLMASAADDQEEVGRDPETGRAISYHGYRYRLLTSQTAAARGGACDYEIGGKMIGGFACVAYPTEYGTTGVMTFTTNHHGVVYQADLGPDTDRLAREMPAFDPGPTWTPVADVAP
jgi:hypothetical protein